MNSPEIVSISVFSMYRDADFIIPVPILSINLKPFF
jgi:hypothetical protein